MGTYPCLFADLPPDAVELPEGWEPLKPDRGEKSVKHLPGQHNQMTHGRGGGFEPKMLATGLKFEFEDDSFAVVTGLYNTAEDSVIGEANPLLGSVDMRVLASIAGAPDGSTVYAEVSLGEEIYLKITNEELGFRAVRKIKLDSEGNTVVENVEMFISPSYQGQGTGTKSFARQVHFASKQKVDHIRTTASADADDNGYYTWPRLGYEAKIPSQVRGKIPVDLRKIKNVSDLMKTESGRKAWKKNGVTVEATFDLKEGSQSRKVLDAYVKAKFQGGKDVWELREKHLPGQHNQMSHGRGGGGDGKVGSDDKLRGEARGRTDRESKNLMDKMIKGRGELGEVEEIVVGIYTSKFGATMNGILRREGKVDLGKHPMFEDLQNATKRELKNPVVVYRGTTKKNFVGKFEEGDVVEAQGFVSTSLSPTIGSTFASMKGERGILLEIKAKRGLPIEDYTQVKGEYELIQSHGTKYKVMGIDKNNDQLGLDIYSLEEI